MLSRVDTAIPLKSTGLGTSVCRTCLPLNHPIPLPNGQATRTWPPPPPAAASFAISCSAATIPGFPRLFHSVICRRCYLLSQLRLHLIQYRMRARMISLLEVECCSLKYLILQRRRLCPDADVVHPIAFDRRNSAGTILGE
ncbi:hypothetical protein KSP40_PGU016362 [Platanthera guangdongensis]|uniref:Uncharacterized protein n=1 Tax=Platanthera guangdongensis TaxID=2320717 RepID=A0ABR2LRP5_9ASPA